MVVGLDQPVPVDGIALVRDEIAGGGITVHIDGIPQSHIHRSDPRVLAFEYMQQIAMVLDSRPPGPLRITHVGGAGLTLPRYVQATRPGSPQIVLEPNEQLTDLVRRELPLPRGHRIRVRAQLAPAALAKLGTGSADVVVVDAFADTRVPPDLTTTATLAEIGRVLAAGGCAVLNLADEPGLKWVARVCAGLATQIGPVMLLGMREVLKGQRFGNLVAVAGGLDQAALLRAAAGAALPTLAWRPQEVARRFAGARPFTDDDSAASPPSPPAAIWRRR